MKAIKKMNILFAPGGAGTLTNITGIVNEHEFDVINEKALANLTHKSLGLWNTATPLNPSAVAEGGTAIFRTRKMLKVKGYSAATRNNQRDLPKSEIIQADVGEPCIIAYELESLDLPGLLFSSRDAFLSYIAATIATSQTAYLDSLYLELAIATANKVAAKQVIEIPNLDDLNTETLRTDAYRTIARAKINIARLVDEYNIGSNTDDYAALLHDIVSVDLLLAMPKGGTTATDVGIKLTKQFKEIAGLGKISDHILWNKVLAKGVSFNDKKAFDFTNYFGAIIHKEALFVAIQGMVTTAAISPNSGNQVFTTKWKTFSKAIRPELLVVFKKKP